MSMMTTAPPLSALVITLSVLFLRISNASFSFWDKFSACLCFGFIAFRSLFTKTMNVGVQFDFFLNTISSLGR